MKCDTCGGSGLSLAGLFGDGCVDCWGWGALCDRCGGLLGEPRWNGAPDDISESAVHVCDECLAADEERLEEERQRAEI
jgi:hypothetical protein